jgi:hypothetical protein
MTHYNPYVQNLIEMGYDEQDCYNVAAVGETNVTYPRVSFTVAHLRQKNNMMMQLLTLSMVFEFV